MARKVYSTYETFIDYINELIEVGYLTKEKVAQHSLRPYPINVIIKCYALSTYRPYDFPPSDYSAMHKYEESFLYLTEKGKDWFFDYLDSKPYAFLHKVFSRVFRSVKKPIPDGESFRNYIRLQNYNGTAGENDTVYHREVRVTRTWKQGNVIREDITYFSSLPEARHYIFVMSCSYPIGQFKLHFKQACGKWRITTPLDMRKKGSQSLKDAMSYKRGVKKKK